MKASKRVVLMVLLSAALVGCSSGGSSSGGGSPEAVPDEPEEQADGVRTLDLSGTWLVTVETRMLKIETGEYLSSDFAKYRYFLEDTENGVRYEPCWTFGDFYAPYGIKTEQHFYMELNKSGFELQSDGSLQQVSTYEREYAPGFSFTSIETLTKLSNSIEFDGGTIVLNGPITVEEHQHVCAWQVYSNIGVRRTIEISTPFDDDYISIRLTFFGDIVEGAYTYADYTSAKEVEIDVSSGARRFWEVTGSNGLFPTDVTVNIMESTSERLSGTYSFTGQDSNLYDGQFEVFLTN